MRRVLALGADPKRLWDFDSARQLAWQAEALSRALELSGRAPPFLGAARQLPQWTPGTKELPNLPAADRSAGLKAALEARRRYDPAAFRAWCAELLATLPAGK